MRKLVVALLLGLSAGGCYPSAQSLKPTLSESDIGNFWFSPDGTLVLSAYLDFPQGRGPFPAVVLMHTCDGVGGTETPWAEVLRFAGYATFVVDSFKGRALREVCQNSRLLSPTPRIGDAYGALRLLATHPRVDARRIALMGFGHGGTATLRAATARAREHYAPAGSPAFRGFIAFYPDCTVRYPEFRQFAAPLRVHTGERDDWAPAKPCEEVIGAARAAGNDAAITVYPAAYYSFDVIGLTLTTLPLVDNAAACRVELTSLASPPPGVAELAGCLRKGATVGGNPAATEQARKSVPAQLAESFK